MYFTCINPTTGEVLYSGIADDPQALKTPDMQVVLEEAPVGTYRDTATGTWQSIGTKPSPAHVWDWGTKAWIDPRTLQDHRDARMRVLKLARDAHITNGFTWDGSVFDSDQVAQTRLLGLKLKAQNDSAMTETWRLQDNTWRVLTASNALAVWDTFEQHLRNAFQTFAGLEAQVAAATTVEQIEGVTWA